jgi:hypothetical protein
MDVIGRWVTDSGNDLYLRARSGSGYASIWLTQCGRPRRIGSAAHANGRIHILRWEPPWRDQTPEWKAQQRTRADELLAAWHAFGPDGARLPAGHIGTVTADDVPYALDAVVDDHAVLAAVGAAGHRPVADVLHDEGRICALVPRPDWRTASDERQRQWRTVASAILAATAR